MNEHSSTIAVTNVAGAARTRRLVLVAGFAILTAIGARISVPLPGTPVPFTLQPVAVLLAGMALGARLGAASQFAYLALGALGLPVFAAGGGLAYLAGPTGGYLLAFPLAAGLTGFVAASGPAWRMVLGGVAGLVVIHLGGASWLSVQPWFQGGSIAAFQLTFVPFLVGDILKVALAAVLALGFGARLRAWLG